MASKKLLQGEIEHVTKLGIWQCVL